MDAAKHRVALVRDRAVKDAESASDAEKALQDLMTDGLGQTRLYEMNQRRGATRGHVLDAPRVTGGQESSAPRVGEPRRARTRRRPRCAPELMANAVTSYRWKMTSRTEDFSVLMKRRTEKVSSLDDEARETVTILMLLGSVLENFKVADVLRGQVRRCSCRQSEMCDRLGPRQ